MNQECQLLFFRLRETSGSEKSVSLMEISRNPSNYLPIMRLFIHRRYDLSYRIFYDQCALSPQPLSAKSVYISYRLTVVINRKFPYANHISHD